MPSAVNFRRLFAASVAVCLAAALPDAAATDRPGVILESFSVGGHEQPLHPWNATAIDTPAHPGRPDRRYAPVRLTVTAQALDFRIAPDPRSGREPARIQFQLDGWDEEWREVEGVMWLSLRFLDDKGRRISSEALPRSGRSSGWSGDPRTAPFRIRSETIVPPPRSRQLQIFLSAGGPRTMGIWLVKSIRLLAAPGGTQPEQEQKTIRIDRGDDLHEPRGVPVGWRREGNNSAIAQVFTLRPAGAGAGRAEHALALVDKDVRSTGRWVAAGENLLPVEPGIPLRLEIEEAFSVGAGGNHTCTYHRLPAGRYTFRAIPVDEFGLPAGGGVELPVTLAPPFHATRWFWPTAGLVATAAAAGGVSYAVRRRLQRRLEQSERRRAIEAERMRIAQDIHDDMGARLTQIALASELALRRTPPGSAASAELQRLDRAARDVVVALDEIVWAVNPAHDTLEGVGNYLSQYVTEIVAAGGGRCRLEIPALLPPRPVSSGGRHHLLMAVKEALNNALKHAAAPEIRVQLVVEAAAVTLVIADNGTGFDPARAAGGNGIANMAGRLKTAGGTCTLRSAPGRGTTVTFVLPLETPGA